MINDSDVFLKTLHMTADCTVFSKGEVSTIIKLSRNLLHVCNDCSNGSKDDVCHYDTYAAKVEFIIKCKVYFP